MAESVNTVHSLPIREAVAVLKRGGLVAFPTETVYGLGADASNPAAVARIYKVKGRPVNHPVIVHIGDAGRLECWAREVPNDARKLAARFWPGPLTLVLKRALGVGDYLTGGEDTIGLRMPNHPVALELLRQFGGGIAAPSANKFGRISPTTAEHVSDDLGDEVDLILDGGPCEIGIESTIIDLSRDRPVLLRPGRISVEEIAATLSVKPEPRDRSAPRAPGRACWNPITRRESRYGSSRATNGSGARGRTARYCVSARDRSAIRAQCGSGPPRIRSAMRETCIPICARWTYRAVMKFW